MDERLRFIVAAKDGDENFSELCRQFGISRKTGYKWLDRYDEHGPCGLQARAPIAHQHPHRTPDAVVDVILKARKEHPFWGPKKLRAFIAERHPEFEMPAASTIGELLKQHGLIRPRRRRPRAPLPGSPIQPSDRPNALWCADFKGHFALGDRSRCHPLTLTDRYSRYLLKCEALPEPTTKLSRVQFEHAFREFGLPDRIRTDNGPPFASVGIGGLSELSVWWIKLGILPERIEPGRPEQNGQHERMHRTLKEEATKPPCATLLDQQRVFDRFRHEYNDVRPHEALEQKPPARLYVRSARVYPQLLRELEYGEDFIVRKTDDKGRLRRKGKNVVLTKLLANELLGLRPLDDDRWELFFGPVLLGVLDETRDEPRLVRAA
nr:integrase core domain-containing protein [Sorangium cellulosum]